MIAHVVDGISSFFLLSRAVWYCTFPWSGFSLTDSSSSLQLYYMCVMRSIIDVYCLSHLDIMTIVRFEFFRIAYVLCVMGAAIVLDLFGMRAIQQKNAKANRLHFCLFFVKFLSVCHSQSTHGTKSFSIPLYFALLPMQQAFLFEATLSETKRLEIPFIAGSPISVFSFSSHLFGLRLHIIDLSELT